MITPNNNGRPSPMPQEEPKPQSKNPTVSADRTLRPKSPDKPRDISESGGAAGGQSHETNTARVPLVARAPVPPQALSKLEALVQKRTVEQAARYSAPLEGTRFKSFIDKDNELADAMQRTQSARTQGLAIKPQRYLLNVGEQVDKAISRRRNFYEDMMLHYGRMFSEISDRMGPSIGPGPGVDEAQMTPQKISGPAKRLADLPGIKLVKTALKRDLALLRQDSSLMMDLLHQAAPLSMQLRPGTFDSMRVESDLEKIEVIIRAEHLEANKPTWNTPNELENARAIQAFDRGIQDKAKLAALAFSHPSMGYPEGTVDAKVIKSKGQDIAQILRDQKPQKVRLANKMAVNAPQMKGTKIDKDSLNAYALAQLSKVSFEPFAMQSIGHGASQMVIKSPSELMDAQQALEAMLTQINDFNKNVLLNHQRMVEKFISALDKDGAQGSRLLQDVGTILHGKSV